MKLKTRLKIAFLTIIILPILLVLLIYGILKITMRGSFRENYGTEWLSIELLANPVEGYGQLTGEEYSELEEIAVSDSGELEKVFFLDMTSEKLKEKASDLLIIIDGKVFYNSGVDRSLALFLATNEETPEISKKGIYLSEYKSIIKSLVFPASDGTLGELFIVTKVTAFMTARKLIGVLAAGILILVATSLCLIIWIRKAVFMPVTELNEGMQKIAEGNLDFVLEPKGTGEIADLYENYNQMRLRLKETAEEKIQIDNQNRELVSNISHDLKTPITSIKGYVEGIMDGVADTPEKMDKYIRTIYNKANDMNRLINELTVYSGIDSNRIPYNFHKLNVADYFGDCVEEVGLDLDAKGIKLNYMNIAPPDTVVIADPEQLKRVINNIINNSVKYMNKPDGVIDIRILDEPESVKVEIEDNGKGVSSKEIGHIFERFYRTDASRNSVQGGSGIGLSIVKKIIEDHGGYIWATSKLDEGTCMHFVLRKYIKNENPEVEI